MATCGCKFYGNQHGSFYRFCEEHGKVMELAAGRIARTPEELFNLVIADYCLKVAREEGLERG